MPVYTFKAPNGKTVKVTGDAPPSEAEIDAIFKDAGVSTAEQPAPDAGHWEDRGMAGAVWHPADGAKEGNRVDNQIGGFPPELAATMAIPVGSALLSPAASMAGRVMAGAKAAVGAATPIVKYEASRLALERLGVPAPLATVAAMAFSGYKHGESAAKTATAEAPAAVEAAAPAAESPLALTQRLKAENQARVATTQPAPAPAIATSEPAIATEPPQAPVVLNKPIAPKVYNELAIAARRAKVTLSGADYDKLAPMVRDGMPAAEAVASLAPRLPVSFGGLPTDAEVQAAVKARNASGRWANPRPGVTQ